MVVVKRRRKSRWRWAQLRNFGRLTFFSSDPRGPPLVEKGIKRMCFTLHFGGDFHQESNNVFTLSI